MGVKSGSSNLQQRNARQVGVYRSLKTRKCPSTLPRWPSHPPASVNQVLTVCLWFKSKLLGEAYINHIANEFLRLKNLFAVMSKAKPGPAFQTLDLYAKA